MKPAKVLRLRQGSPEWHDYRRTRVGASDAPGIVGESPYSSPYSIWRDKIEGRSDPDAGTAHRFMLGHAMEPVIRDLYREQTGRKVRPGRVLESRIHPWQFASLDGEADGRLVECKWTTSSRFDDGPPADVLVQVQHQMGVSGAEVTDVAVLTPVTFRVYEVPFDPAVWSWIDHIEEEFVRDYLLPGVPPPTDGSEATRKALTEQFPEDTGSILDADPDAARLVRRLLDAKARALLLDGEIGGMENALRFILGDASEMRGEGFSVTYRKARDSEKVSWERYAHALEGLLHHAYESSTGEIGTEPDLGPVKAEATSTVAGTRRLLVRPAKEVQE